MDRRFEVRKRELLEEAKTDPRVYRGALRRMEKFIAPFAALLREAEQRRHAAEYVAGLISDVKRKSAEAIAYQHDQDRQGKQKFLGQVPWDDRPLIGELARQVGEELGEPDGVIAFDPSSFPKRGSESVGVQRQWCGRLGKVENCQVGIYLGYVSAKDHALVDTRLYLPRDWTQGKKRRRKAGIPDGVRFQTRHALALDMLREHGATLPHAWVTGDDEMGRSSGFRRDLHGLGERYVLAVPSNTTVRDLEAAVPEYSGRGPRPKAPFVRVDRWREALGEKAWTQIEVRAGAKGPVVVEAAKARVLAKSGRRAMEFDEVLIVFRERQGNGSFKYDYCLSNAPFETPLKEFARVANAEHRIEDCLKRAKSQAGLAEYQVRNWIGWHHHQTLSLLATWFLIRESRRGKKIHPVDDGSSGARTDRVAIAQGPRLRRNRPSPPPHRPLVGA